MLLLNQALPAVLLLNSRHETTAVSLAVSLAKHDRYAEQMFTTAETLTGFYLTAVETAARNHFLST